MSLRTDVVNQKLTSARVTYDECSVKTDDMNADQGTFTSSEPGVYQFTFSALFVAMSGDMVRNFILYSSLSNIYVYDALKGPCTR